MVLIVILVCLVLLVRSGYDLAGAVALVGAGTALAGFGHALYRLECEAGARLTGV